MYQPQDSLENVKGIGTQLAKKFSDKQIHTIKELILNVPYRYEDRSKVFTITQLQRLEQIDPKAFYTIKASVIQIKNSYLRGGKTLQVAKVQDSTGEMQITWFNNHFIVDRLQQKISTTPFLFSGKIEKKNTQVYIRQPICEQAGSDSIHTNRLVPIYSVIPGVAPSIYRKLLKEICNNIHLPEPIFSKKESLTLLEALKQIHFPDSNDSAVRARERLALEELLVLIEKSRLIKLNWRAQKAALQVSLPPNTQSFKPPKTVPFTLTTAQQRCTAEILYDLSCDTPMNRILIGDVGSGKTIVAGLAMQRVVEAGYFAAVVAPTEILARQHTQTLKSFFPDLMIYLLTGSSKPNVTKPGIIVGTHAVLNHFKSSFWHIDTKRVINQGREKINNQLGLIVFDEQHRFGVSQRSDVAHFEHAPHVLTMTATPIPRSLLLTIFSHLSLSVIDELPKNRLPTKTWIVEEHKRQDMYLWLQKQASLQTSDSKFQTIIVCPFIDPSNAQALENIANAKEMFNRIKKIFTKPTQVELLHARLSKKEKQAVIDDLFGGRIQVLVTTPIVEVGVDLPQASAIVIEAAERFGLASLHQLRGRVGRAGQQGYCLLFTNSKSAESRDRLNQFCQILSGQKLAELDLKRRGAGELFGTMQHGFDELRFANWSDLSLIQKAKQITDSIHARKEQYHSPFFSLELSKLSKIGAN